ncbi:hypothetical protein [Aquimarina megaterium]|uniref:hypothetical protein n=1 Tax=Aquimarina megaterium TaxID=1443666 RepID=UPI001112A08B|nr:hypothetical protein [Aquimarina megaterium]
MEINTSIAGINENSISYFSVCANISYKSIRIAFKIYLPVSRISSTASFKCVYDWFLIFTTSLLCFMALFTWASSYAISLESCSA